MKNSHLLFVLLSIISIEFIGCASADKSVDNFEKGNFITVNTYAPVFNITEIYKFLKQLPDDLKTDKRGLLPEIAFIAPPGTNYLLVEKIHDDKYEIVKIRNLASDNIYYIDSRFTSQSHKTNKVSSVLTEDDIIINLKAMVGYPYEYGGETATGIYKLAEMYEISELDIKLKPTGLDCSGLIYQATNGLTPRTSTEMIKFGEGLDIEGKDLSEILQLIKPLDIIGYPGHVFIVIDNDNVIEASRKYGVIVQTAEKRLKSLMKNRKPVNDASEKDKNKIFAIRRWFNN